MILSIDPGNIQSAFCWIDKDFRIENFGKIPNDELLTMIYESEPEMTVIEMIASYGMAVGKEVFDTCVWIGRFTEASLWAGKTDLVFRKDVKLNLCGQTRAKDSNVVQALKDRFGDKGTKAKQGFFYGFKADCWQAFAVGVTWMDRQKEGAKC